MYKTDIHEILKKALGDVLWTRIADNEDSFRQAICSKLSAYIGYDSISVPSTRSGKGDIVVFDKTIELKYACKNKRFGIEKAVEDFDLLLDKKIHFYILGICVRDNKAYDSRCVDHYVLLNRLKDKNVDDSVLKHSHDDYQYYMCSVLAPAGRFHDVRILNVAENKKVKKKPKSYMSFVNAPEIIRSSFLKVNKNYIHVDVVGCFDDGLVIYLYTRADDLIFMNGDSRTLRSSILHNDKPIIVSTVSRADACVNYVCTLDDGNAVSRVVENDVCCFDITCPSAQK